MDFFRITSRFTNARFHPILKRYRAHHGVDYAAPVGTEVKSIGAGTVIAKGYMGGGGHTLKVKHNSVYTTSYMHLSKYAKGIQVGSHVGQGQVIGYVGSTGLSTGPHLDFRVYKNGQPINPLQMEAPPSLPVKPELRDSFAIVKQTVLAELDSMRVKIIYNIDAMKFLGNIIWLICGGLLTAVEYLISSLLLMITIIGIPFGLQTLKLGMLALWPFGSRYGQR